MDDATLARLEHENMLDWLRLQFSQVPGAVIRDEAGVGLYATGLPIPLFNQLVVDDGAVADEIRAGVGILRGRGAPFYVVLRRPQDASVRPLMTELQLAFDDGFLPGMALHPIPHELRATAPGLEIRVVDDPAGLRDHALVAAHGFGVPEPIAVTLVGEELWRRDGATVYVGYARDEPVTAGFAVTSGPTQGIFTIATIPEARGRGFGAAMTSRLVADGAAAGCTVAVLQASDMGRPIYERIGFRVVQDYEIYVG